MTVLEFLDGRPLGDQDLRDPETASQTARLVAAIHAATPALTMPVPFVETFAVADAWRRSARMPAAPTGWWRRHGNWVWPERDALLAMLGRVQALGEAARSRATQRVLCHGDLIGDNLLMDGDGRLWLVDWDGAALAPRELDLALCSGEGFEPFLAAYQGDGGPPDLDSDLIAFFLLRRNLDDLVDWLGAVLDSQLPDGQRHADLDGVRWCMSCWTGLEARIGRTRRLLAQRGDIT